MPVRSYAARGPHRSHARAQARVQMQAQMQVQEQQPRSDAARVHVHVARYPSRTHVARYPSRTHEPRHTSHEGRHATHDRSGRARRAAIAISVSFPGPRAGSCARARNKLGTRIHEAYRISEPQFLSSSTHFTMSWGGIDGAGLASVPPTCMVAERHRTRGGPSLETRCAKLVFAQVCTVASVERT